MQVKEDDEEVSSEIGRCQKVMIDLPTNVGKLSSIQIKFDTYHLIWELTFKRLAM